MLSLTRSQAITVRLADGTLAKWGLGYVDVTNTQTGALVSFEHHRYITVVGPPVRIERSSQKVRYDIKCTTSDTAGASTDAALVVKLVGDKGSTEEVRILCSSLILSYSLRFCMRTTYTIRNRFWQNGLHHSPQHHTQKQMHCWARRTSAGCCDTVCCGHPVVHWTLSNWGTQPHVPVIPASTAGMNSPAQECRFHV